MDTVKLWREICRNIQSPTLRNRAFTLALQTGSVLGLERTVAFTASGKASVGQIEKWLRLKKKEI